MDPNNFTLRKEPDPILYKKLEDFVFEDDQYLKSVERKMIELMEINNGIGISANQVGFDRRVIVIWPRAHSELKEPFALFNPKIVAANTEETEDEEGCLSFPDLFFKVSRPKDLVVEFVDSNGKNRIITLYGYDAKCVQHEIDHLDGICFTSKISKLKLDMARKKQRKLQHGRTK